MDEHEWLADQFEGHRPHLHAVAYRMLGSLSEADDAIQEAWNRLSRSDAHSIENFGGWLTTVVSRVCLNMLRSRGSRREEAWGDREPEGQGTPADPVDPEHEVLLADSVGPALLVVLDTLAPPERLAFVLHDMFALPFDEIAPIVGCSSTAARQLASRARRRIHGASTVSEVDLTRQRAVVDAFLAASRHGDFGGLVAVLAPEVVLRADRTSAPSGVAREVRGAEAVAKGASAFSARARFAEPALVDGSVGVVLAPRGRLFMVVAFTIEDDLIAEIDIIGDADRLRHLDLAVLD